MTALDTLCSELLSISISQRYRPFSQEFADETWQSLPACAARNRVGALLFDAISLLPGTTKVPRQVVMDLALQAEEAERSYNSRLAVLKELEQLAGRHYAVLKGFALASLYPRPEHRASTDIDIFGGEQTDRLASLLQRQGIACDGKNPRHLTFLLNGILVEAHQYLFYTPLARKLFADWESTATVKLPLARHALFFLAHTAYDAVFFDLPIPWRTCCDWLLLLKRLEATPAERAQFEQEIRGASFEHFAKAFTLSCRLRFPLLTEGLEPPRDDPFHRDTFWKMFRDPRPRHGKILPRVCRRAGKYLRYNRYYKALFGQNMFRAFYLHNLWVALWQRHPGHKA